MKVISDLVIYPLGSQSITTQDCLSTVQQMLSQVITTKQLKYTPHSTGVNIEGELDDIMEILKTTHMILHKSVPRLVTDLRIHSRVDRKEGEAGMEEQVKKVQQQVGK